MPFLHKLAILDFRVMRTPNLEGMAILPAKEANKKPTTKYVDERFAKLAKT